MKISALSDTDILFQRISDFANQNKLDAMALSDVPTTDNVKIYKVSLRHESAEYDYLPYLSLEGYITNSVPAVELPWGIDEFTFEENSVTPVMYRYDFNYDQLIKLITDKGFFSGNVQLNQDVVGEVLELPGLIDCMIVKPEDLEDVPVSFVTHGFSGQREIDVELSGLDLTDLFADYVDETQVQHSENFDFDKELSTEPTQQTQFEDTTSAYIEFEDDDLFGSSKEEEGILDVVDELKAKAVEVEDDVSDIEGLDAAEDRLRKREELFAKLEKSNQPKTAEEEIAELIEETTVSRNAPRDLDDELYSQDNGADISEENVSSQAEFEREVAYVFADMTSEEKADILRELKARKTSAAVSQSSKREAVAAQEAGIPSDIFEESDLEKDNIDFEME